MFNGIPVSYIYEFSSTLITLPPFLIEFDWERLAPAEEALLTLFKDGPLNQEKWHKLMPTDYGANTDHYDTLFEFDQGIVGLSAMGYLMKARLEAAEHEADVLLSPTAESAWSAATAGLRAQFDSILTRVRNPLHRASGKHSESLNKTDLKVWKVYGNSGPRMLYWVESDRILVGELFGTHDEYEQYIDRNPLRRRDYAPMQFRTLDRVAPPDYGVILDEIRQANATPVDLTRALEEELRNSKIELQRLRTTQNSHLKRLREEAENRGFGLGRKAAEAKASDQIHLMQRQQDEMRNAYMEGLRNRDEEIADLKSYIQKLQFAIESISCGFSSDPI
jgi:hypothetical protein